MSAKRAVTIEVCPFPLCGYVQSPKTGQPERPECPNHPAIPQVLERYTIVVDPSDNERPS